MAPLAIGYCLILLLFLGLPRRRANPALETDAVRTRRTASVLGLVHLAALIIPLVAVRAVVSPRAEIAMWVGLALTSRSIIAVLTVTSLTIIGYAYRLTEEERVLMSWMSERYRAYAARTKRLVPFVW